MGTRPRLRSRRLRRGERLCEGQGNAYRLSLVKVLAFGLILACAVGETPPAFGQSSDQLSRGINAYWSGEYAVAVQLLRPLADAGNAEAQYILSQSYALLNWSEHVEAVLYWSRAAAEQGHRGAQFQQGYFYQNGLGVDRNDRVAAGWYEMAAKQCHTHAKYELGKMYRHGRGVPRDEVLAYAWLSAASMVPGVFEEVHREREDLAEELTPGQREKGQRLALELYDEYGK